MLRLILIAIIAPMFFPTVALGDIIGSARVVDGDTIKFSNERIRLYGIDAPENTQTCSRNGVMWGCGIEATKLLSKLIGKINISCIGRTRDHYGRLIADCSANGENLSAAMVESGLALAYRKYSKDYVNIEATAKMAKRGLWSGQFIPPWEWRKGKRLTPLKRANGSTKSCKIKGNIGAKGARIYHVPGNHWYDKTIISKSRGERWFCSEEEARSTGWRRAGTATDNSIQPNTEQTQIKQRPQKACCKICRKSQPCGNSCISRRYTCRRPVGCAC